MSSADDPHPRLIWATRGRRWGFRFLLDAGLTDPLPTYRESFAVAGDDDSGWWAHGERAALRFPDPLGRRDASGRVIPHEFVVFGEMVTQITTVADGVSRLWGRFAPVYARIWDADRPPTPDDLRFSR
ncbi:MAG: hypothetical protein M3Y71_01455 [Actinomycetota bacterium]|nr:hypothetical protein [Actinomycetota bacterium]